MHGEKIGSKRIAISLPNWLEDGSERPEIARSAHDPTFDPTPQPRRCAQDVKRKIRARPRRTASTAGTTTWLPSTVPSYQPPTPLRLCFRESADSYQKMNLANTWISGILIDANVQIRPAKRLVSHVSLPYLYFCHLPRMAIRTWRLRKKQYVFILRIWMKHH